jgi:hypothetical protein
VTSAWRYGVGLDQRLGRNVFVGAEYSRRDLTVPFTDASDPAAPVNREGDGVENLARFYAFATPHRWVGLRAEYIYERFKNAPEIAFDLPLKTSTHRVPIGASVFHPSGFGVSAVATFFRQDGEFLRLGAGDLETGTSEFWIVDAAVAYRLPRRVGAIAVGARNMLDTKFEYYGTDSKSLLVQPVRTVFGKVTLAFP